MAVNFGNVVAVVVALSVGAAVGSTWKAYEWNEANKALAISQAQKKEKEHFAEQLTLAERAPRPETEFNGKTGIISCTRQNTHLRSAVVKNGTAIEAYCLYD